VPTQTKRLPFGNIQKALFLIEQWGFFIILINERRSQMAKYTLIHLSDLHIGNSEKEFNNTNRIIKKIGASYKGIPVIITGDLTHSATKGQFKKMRDILRELAKTNPILTAPGNHDYAHGMELFFVIVDGKIGSNI